MVTWQQIGQGEPNPFDVTYTNNSTYSASYGEFVITEGGQVDLPSPSANAAVAVRSFEQEVRITTPSGNIRDSRTTGEVDLNSPRYVILVSDGTNWYVQNNESGIGPAIPDSVVDDFEDGNISEYSGDTGAFSVVQDRTYDGSYALYSNATSSAVITAGTADGLNDIPKRGDTFRYSFYITTLDRDMRVFWAGGTNGYDLSWWSTNRSGIGGTWELRDGSGNVLDNNGTDAPTDKWGVVEVDFSDPIVCDVYQASEYSDGTPMVTLSTSDDSHDSGDILWYANAGSSGEQWYDAFYTT